MRAAAGIRLPVALASALAAQAAAANAADADTCLDAPYTEARTEAAQQIAELVARFRAQTGAFPSLVRALDTHGPRICLRAGAADARGYFDVETNVVAIHASLDDAERLAILIHETRHLDQVGRGICPSDDLAMDEVARATFAMEADANAVLAHVAYELRAAGDPALWEALAGFGRYADIAVAYAASRDASQSVGHAMGDAFAQWYASDWRRESYYLASCGAYLDRADDSHVLPSYQALDEGFYEALCLLPDGTSYDCAAPGGEAR